jgi:hypothetical protein
MLFFTRFSMTRIHTKHLIAALAALSMASTAFAQYIWLNERGVKQYSDMPPPASVPQSRILKQPGGISPATAQKDAAVAETVENSPEKDKAPMTIAEKNADFQKRRAEQAEKEKKAQEQAKDAAAKAKNCERASEYHQVLASRQRVVRTDKNGERSFMTDEQRERELREAKSILEGCR